MPMTSMSVQFLEGFVPSNASSATSLFFTAANRARQKRQKQLVGRKLFNISNDLGWRVPSSWSTTNFIGNKAQRPSCCCLAIRNGKIEPRLPFSFATRLQSIGLRTRRMNVDDGGKPLFRQRFPGHRNPPTKAAWKTARSCRTCAASLEESVDRITSYGIR